MQTPCNVGRLGGVRCYLDKSDKNSTSSLKEHLNRCRPGLFDEVKAGKKDAPNKKSHIREGKLTAYWNRQTNVETYSSHPFTREESR